MKKFITRLKDLDKKETQLETQKMLEEIGELQYQMMANREESILLVLQGLDASGKDGLVRRLLSCCNPVGLSVTSFKVPTKEEYAHDFLWRIHKHTPAKGQLKVFVRSHYEDILVPAVEGYIQPEIVEQRYELINNFEKLIQHNGTRILKFYMSVSAKAQMERLEERVTNPQKHWKHNDSDFETLKKRDQYLEVYEQILVRCNQVPWHIIPCDKNWQKLFVASKILLDTLKGFDMKWPDLESDIFEKEK